MAWREIFQNKRKGEIPEKGVFQKVTGEGGEISEGDGGRGQRFQKKGFQKRRGDGIGREISEGV